MRNPALFLAVFLLLTGCAVRQAQPESALSQGDKMTPATSGSFIEPFSTGWYMALLEKKAPALICNDQRTRWQKPTTPLPRGVRIIDCARGDLNGDGYEDMAVVLEWADTPPLNAEDCDSHFGAARSAVVLHGGPDGAFRVKHIGNEVILERCADGAFGDPYTSTTIQDNSLQINHYGGSAFRWDITMVFRYMAGQLRLASETNISSCIHHYGGEKTVYDYIAGTLERRSWSCNEEMPSDYPLYSGKIDKKVWLFDTMPFDYGTRLLDTPPLPLLPYLDSYYFDRFLEPLELRLSASQALDMVRRKHYPALQKQKMPWTRENRRNYSRLLFYEVPDHYYQGPDGVLQYFMLDIESEDGKPLGTPVHEIIYVGGKSVGFDDLYSVDDLSGEIKKQ